MKKTILLVAMASFIFTACEKKTETEKVEDVQTETVETTAEESTEMTTNEPWAGTYQGVLPCADCGGIDTEIMIHDNNTYMETQNYLDKEGENSFKFEGTVVWNEDKTQFTLTPSKEGENAVTYKVQEGSIVALDADGNEYTGDIASAYVLNKK